MLPEQQSSFFLHEPSTASQVPVVVVAAVVEVVVVAAVVEVVVVTASALKATSTSDADEEASLLFLK